MADDQVVVIGAHGKTGPGSGYVPGGTFAGCIIINTRTDREVEGNEDMGVLGRIIRNADLAKFPDGDRVVVTIIDASGESVLHCVVCVCVCVCVSGCVYLRNGCYYSYPSPVFFTRNVLKCKICP